MVVSRGIQPIFWGKRKPPCLAPWKQNVLKHFVLLDFMFMLYLTLYCGNQVADCWFHPLEHKSAPSSWLEAELSLQAGRTGDVEVPGGRTGSLCHGQGALGLAVLPPECTFSIWSVKTAAVCPKTCVCCVLEGAPSAHRGLVGFAARAGVKCTFWCCTHSVPRAARPCENSQLWPGLSSVLV